MMFAATTAGGPPFPIRATAPEIVFAPSSVLPALPVIVTGPLIRLPPHGGELAALAEPICTEPPVPLTETGPAIVLSHTVTWAAPSA